MNSQDIVPSIRLEEADECEIVSISNRRTEVDTHKNAPFTAQGRLRMVQADSRESDRFRLVTDGGFEELTKTGYLDE